MRFTLATTVILVLTSPIVLAQTGPATASAEPFKLGTFEILGAPAVGLVLRDNLIVHVDRANAALERNPAYPKIPMPADMLDLIGRYEYGMKLRLYEIVNDLVGNNRLAANR